VSLGEPVVAQALGRAHRADPVLARTGGPAGNARLTAWTGLVLLVLFLAELVTLLDTRGLIGWHVAIGTLLIPPALLKTASAGWRIVQYYTGDRSYRAAGPPPVVLRVLGPLVVATTLAVLASGVVLVVAGEPASREALVTVLGQPINLVAFHKVAFVGWAAITGLHTVGRLIPALQLTLARRARLLLVPGRRRRATALVAACLVAVAAAVLVLGAAGSWRSRSADFHRQQPGQHARHD
jgi:hypothetical protein